MDVKDEGRKQIIEEFELSIALGKPVHVRHKAERTPLQRVIEDCEGMDLEEILDRVEPLVLAKRYHLDLSTVSKWKERLGWFGDRREG